MSRSGNLDFFAAEADQRALLDFLFSSTDVRVFESYSEFGDNLREFRSTRELSTAFPIGTDRHGNGAAILLELCSPSVVRKPNIRRISLDPSHCKGHTFRYTIEGGGLIQLYLGGVYEQIITRSHYGHWSRVGAQKCQQDDGVNWEALKRLSGQIQYQIRTRMAAGKAGTGPILPQALELAQSGFALKEAKGHPTVYEVQSLRKVPLRKNQGMNPGV